MKLKYLLTLVVIFTIFLLFAGAVTGENVDNSTVSDGTLAVDSIEAIAVGGDENQNNIADDSRLCDGNGDDTDLSVRVDVKNVYKGKEFNRPGFEIPWNITSKVSGATAHNVKISVVLSNNMEYVSHDLSVGTFNPTTKIWDIGDLNPSDSPLLVIVTKLKGGKMYRLTAEGTCDGDLDSSNNKVSVPISGGTNKSRSNTTETTATKNSITHSEHMSSMGSGSGERKMDDDSSKGNSNTNSKNSDFNSNSKSDSKKDENSNSVAKSISSDNILSRTLESAGNLLSNPNQELVDEKSDNSSSNAYEKGMMEYDYIKLPLMIFALFLIIIVVVVGYNKIKS